MSHHDVVVLRPSRVTALSWTAVGFVVTALAVWVLVDARGALLAWLFVCLALVVATFFAMQLRPSWFEVRLDPDGIAARYPWGSHRRYLWDDVRWARVVRVTGEPVLELHLGDEDTHAVGLLLPLGADLEALRAVLERRLGRV